MREPNIFIRVEVLYGCIVTNYICFNDQLADIFMKSLRGLQIEFICNKLGAYNLYAQA
jgi:hypothetical protein